MATDPFILPFDEATAWFRRKLNMPTERWDELPGPAHVRAFASAGAMRADLLADLRAMVDRAIAGRMDIREFREQFLPLVEKYGWKLKGGGPGWRAELIIRQNIQNAYQAGRWEQFEEAGVKWLKYVHLAGQLRPRPHHVALHGTVLPRTDPFWQLNYPPNGFRCKCRAVPATKAEIAAAGGTPKRPEGWENAPDKGFDYNIGLKRDEAMDRRATAVPERLRDVMRECAKASCLFAAGEGERAKQVGAKALEKLVRDLGILEPGYVFDGVDFNVSDPTARAQMDWYRPKPGGGYEHGGKLRLNPNSFNMTTVDKTGATRQVEWRPAEGLFRALRKAQLGETLGFMDEAALRMLEHESGHTWQKAKQTLAPGERTFLEMVNEWRARREYPEIMRKLGLEPNWAEEMKKHGHGYVNAVANLDALFAHHGIADDAALLDKMNRINRNTEIADYRKAVYNLIRDNKSKDAKPMKKTLEAAVNWERLSRPHEWFMENVIGVKNGGAK